MEVWGWGALVLVLTGVGSSKPPTVKDLAVLLLGWMVWYAAWQK